MPSWLKDFLGGLYASGRAALRWIEHADNAWANWVDSMIHTLWRDIMQSYILLTYDVANFSWYVGSFSRSTMVHLRWLRLRYIPRIARYLYNYTSRRVRDERRWRRAEIRQTRRYLLGIIRFITALLQKQIAEQGRHDRKARWKLREFLLGFIGTIAQSLQNQIYAEIRNRKAEIARVRQYILQVIAALAKRVNAIIPTVNTSAADGYNSVRSGQADVVTKIIDDLATDNPVVKDLVGKLVQLVLDLVEADDPLTRIAAGLLLTQVIDRLGVDKLAGGLASDLAGVLLGGAKPGSLQQVCAQIAQRLQAGESQWQQFYANGGDDMERLGRQMRESSSPLFLLPLGAYFAAATADPAGTAAATDTVVTPAVRTLVTPIIDALGAL